VRRQIDIRKQKIVCFGMARIRLGQACFAAEPGYPHLFWHGSLLVML
jgi:hypothetical protein